MLLLWLVFTKKHGKLATVTAVQPLGRYGPIDIDENKRAIGFIEKPKGDGGWVNGGFFVLSPKVIDFIEDDTSSWEDESLTRIAELGELMAYQHKGFWQPMDTLRDKNYLEELWLNNKAPWKIW